MPKILSLIAVLCFGFASAQELNCTVTVNADQVGGTNQQVYKTLQKSLTDYINKTDWTGQGYKNNERINCSMFINVSSAVSGVFTATIQVSASRPAYNSTYASPILNFNDKEFTFNYNEFQNLTFNPTVFESNLISVVSYYCFMIIGMDADTFSLERRYFLPRKRAGNRQRGRGKRLQRLERKRWEFEPLLFGQRHAF
ncbi:DUF4835 family protein [Flavobacterium sp.]|uniref:type IX secretion system protein PorD n=1 Tax=Flavobacterium sp. TaxID=239 RepID=UPI0039E30341